MKDHKEAKVKPLLIIILSILGIVIFILIGAYSGLVDGGSYPYAQQYKFEVNDPTLIRAIKDFKKDNPNFKVPEDLSLPDSSDSYRYNFYLYYQDKSQLFHCFLMTADDSKGSSIYLDAVNNGLILGNWKRVNEDYDRDANLKIKKEFRERFLNKLKLAYHDEGNGSFVFWK